MAPKLDDLLEDGRHWRLFAEGAGPCALQLWVLQIRDERNVESRVLYGRLLPYSYADRRWSAPEKDKFRRVGSVETQIVLLSLYLQSAECAELLRQLSAGETISDLSHRLPLELSERLRERFGTTRLGDGLVYRIAAHLPNRDAWARTLSSPHAGASALSAAMSRTDKSALFLVRQQYDAVLTRWIIERLRADTGLDFGGVDRARLGDLELIVFPALDDHERALLHVDWRGDARRALVARFDPRQVPAFNEFQFRLAIENDGNLIQSRLATAARDADGVFECVFELGDGERGRTDTAELEIFGFDGGTRGEGTLCCRWRGHYIREIVLQGHAVGSRTGPVKFDWLEKGTRPSSRERVQAALLVNRGEAGFRSQVGGREADPWVPANRDLSSLLARLHPASSDGRFFLHRSRVGAEGRLEFVEWFKALLAKHSQRQVIIFDPYFEDAGLGLTALHAAPGADVIVFTSLPKPPTSEDAEPSAPDPIMSDRINNLVASCEHNRHLLSRLKLRIFGLKEGRLHDRYIVVVGPDGLPEAGFNLSNSLQKAAENYPLLVTPIPPDVLLEVERYASDLVREAEQRGGGGTPPQAVSLLFESSSAPPRRRYEPLRFLDDPRAGDVLSLWAQEPSLTGVSGEALKSRMTRLGWLNEGALALPDTAGLRNFVAGLTSDPKGFISAWNVVGEVLAHSHADDSLDGLSSADGLLGLVAQYLKTAFARSYSGVETELSVMEPRLLRMPLPALLDSSYRADHFLHPIKYAPLTWADYFAIKVLWRNAPDALLGMAEAQIPLAPEEPTQSDAVRLSLLGQIASELSTSVELRIDATRRASLLSSQCGLLQWFGLSALERELAEPGDVPGVMQAISGISDADRVRVLGWMVRRAARGSRMAAYPALVNELHRALPPVVSFDALVQLIDAMRGHMRDLAWAGSWLLDDVVRPLLDSGRVQVDDICRIWAEDLARLLGPTTGSRIFQLEREGNFTNVTAWLYSQSSAAQRQDSTSRLSAILKRKRHVLHRPLASTSDWERWDDALQVSMWILTFSRWAQFYLLRAGLAEEALEELAKAAHELALRRPLEEWRAALAHRQDGLAASFDQAEELLSGFEASTGGAH